MTPLPHYGVVCDSLVSFQFQVQLAEVAKKVMDKGLELLCVSRLMESTPRHCQFIDAQTSTSSNGLGSRLK